MYWSPRVGPSPPHRSPPIKLPPCCTLRSEMTRARSPAAPDETPYTAGAPDRAATVAGSSSAVSARTSAGRSSFRCMPIPPVISAERRDQQERRGPEDGNRAEDDSDRCLMSSASASSSDPENDRAEAD